MSKHWTEEEDAKLTEMWKERIRVGEIVQEVGRTRPSIEARASRLGLRGRKLGCTRSHPVNALKVGESVFVPDHTETRRSSWLSAAARAGIDIVTRSRVQNGQRGFRILRIEL